MEMRERNQNAKLYLTEALKEATIYVNGDVVRVNGKEVGSRINEAIGRLVQTVYHKLSYIDTPMGEAEIRKMLHQSNQLSLGLEGGYRKQCPCAGGCAGLYRYEYPQSHENLHEDGEGSLYESTLWVCGR